MRKTHLSAGITMAIAGAGLLAAPAYAAHPGVNANIAYVETSLGDDPGTGTTIDQKLMTIDPTTRAEKTLSKSTLFDPDVATGPFLKAPEYTPDGTKLIVNAFSPAQAPAEALGSLLGIFLPTGRNLRIIDANTATTQCEHAGPVGLPSRHHYDPTTGQTLLSRLPTGASPFAVGTGERISSSCVGGQGGTAAGTPLSAFFAKSSDGQYLAEGIEAGSDSPPVKLKVRKLDGSFEATYDTGFVFHPDMHPNGEEVVFGTAEDPFDSPSIKVINIKTGATRTVVDGFPAETFLEPVFSPDGKYIAYTRATPETAAESGLYTVKSSRIAGAPGAEPPTALASSATGTTLFAMPDWGGTPVPSPPLPAAGAPAEMPASAAPGVPGAPGSGNQVCGAPTERTTSKKGTPTYTRTGLKIQQNIDSATLRRLNGINALLEAGLPASALCTGAFGPAAFQAGMSFIGGGHQNTSPPVPPEIEIKKRTGKRGTITRSRRQLVINENIGRALRARAEATYERVMSLTGGNLAADAKLGGRVVWQGLAAAGAQPASVDAPATELEIGNLPKKLKIRENARTVRNQQRRSQSSITLANKALDAINTGLTPESFRPGTIGSKHI